MPVTLIVAGLILCSVWVERVFLRWLSSMPAVPSPAGTATSPTLKNDFRIKSRKVGLQQVFQASQSTPLYVSGRSPLVVDCSSFPGALLPWR